MKTEDSLSKGIIRRIVFITLVLIILLGVGAFAGNQSVNSVKIQFSDGTELSVITSRANVNEILKENNIYVSENEKVTPDFSENIDSSRTIIISRRNSEENNLDNQEPENIEVIESSQILNDEEEVIIEKIVKETVEIPFETITKEVSTSATNGQEVSQILQEGENGIKEITYKIKYKNDKELEKIKISEKVIKEPVDKIVQITVVVSSRAAAATRIQAGASASAAECQAFARQRCSDYGWSDEDYYNLVVLWEHESHWNMYASNSYSGAYGIPQALPASKMASAGGDYLTNYQTQINWGLSYISGRYGTPTAAYYHSQATGWY